jgi:toxin ParE1/3/4
VSYDVVRTAQADRDLEDIFDFLMRSRMSFSASRDEALKDAARRLMRIEASMRRLGRQPHQGTLRNTLRPGLRSVTKDLAIFYFETDDDARRLRVLAVFFGGQDHQRQMLVRLMQR